jgi:Lon protease-like protein
VEELGLFLLGIVLLPTERVPLHIFEPRYRELIGECLEHGGEFGLLYAEGTGLRKVGTRARVTDLLEELDDGRMNVVVEGGERFGLVELTSGRSFHTGRVEPVEDDAEPPAPQEAEAAREALRSLAGLAEVEPDETDPASPRLSFELAAQVELAPEPKQRLLELRSERARLALVVELFAEAAQRLVLERDLRERASRNGSRRRS